MNKKMMNKKKAPQSKNTRTNTMVFKQLNLHTGLFKKRHFLTNAQTYGPRVKQREKDTQTKTDSVMGTFLPCAVVFVMVLLHASF